MTNWEAGGFYYEAFEVPEPDGTFLLTAAHQDDLTPRQVITATLGAGTCRMAFGVDMLPECGNCGEPLVYYTRRHGMQSKDKRSARYCPKCGARVVDE